MSNEPADDPESTEALSETCPRHEAPNNDSLPPASLQIATNTQIGRLNKEIKRRTNVVGIFPSDLSALRLIGAVLADQHDEWIIARRYLSEGSMAQLATTRQTAQFQSGELAPAA